MRALNYRGYLEIEGTQWASWVGFGAVWTNRSVTLHLRGLAPTETMPILRALLLVGSLPEEIR